MNVSPAAERNKEPIAKILADHLKPGDRVLEIASGTGQHAVHFSQRFPDCHWQPSDADAENLASIEWHRDLHSGTNLSAPLRLSTLDDRWSLADDFNAIFCANMIHISPIASCIGLFRLGAHHLTEDGSLFLYGPFFLPDRETAPSNLQFDASLRSRDPECGIRHLDQVEQIAGEFGFWRQKIHDMPANNVFIAFDRR